MPSERDNESRYSKSTTRTVRTTHTSASNATKASNASGASISSEQRSKEYSRQRDRDEGRERDRERKGDSSRDRERDRYPSSNPVLSKTSSRAPSEAPSITPSQSISVCAPPKHRSSDQKSRSGSSAASSATIKLSHRKSSSSEAPSIRSNLPTVPEDRTIIADPKNGYRRSVNPSEANQSTYSSRTHESNSSRKSQSIYNPAASRAPTELSNMSKAEISRYMPDARDFQGIKNRHRSMGSVADSVMNHMERKAGRDLGNTLLLDEDGTPIGVAEMKLGSKYDEGGLFELNRVDEGGKRLSDRRHRRGDSPGRSNYSDMRSDSGRRTVVPADYQFSERGSSVSENRSNSDRRTVVPADYQFSERGSSVSENRSNSDRRTLVPAGYEFSDRGSSVSGHSSRTRTSAAPSSSASSGRKYKTKEVRPDGY
ncbi:dfe3d04f-efcc-44b5-bbc8-a6f724254d85-CDS [Sclerotinia trifoliorum]|uniref:Dfe3d04f-efcc-44b5-bbc8-a6f724254d85-CDS n=1 Tax=Sclerotinia trifoliorum TaxID=28548 RepID=A0A8H2ZWB8_9HELO|nr:dfe3d04f-efcc-44b5-bbc8-a6f724254d85-CDS [Sclerotinia trifoliorum]